jgi:uncharacterized phage infection (PIP) family protein YhgE
MTQCYIRIWSIRGRKLIDALALALLKGLAGGLGERLIKGPGDKVAIKSLTGEVKELSAAQQETQLSITELIKIFEEIASNTDGLIVTRSKIRFQATEKTPTLGDALLNLDQEIEAMRSAADKAASLKAEAQHLDTAQPVKPAQEASALSGLDHEISALRSRSRNE